MKRELIGFTLVACACAFLGMGPAAGGTVAVDDAAYTPLKLYDGKWQVSPSADEKEPPLFENHCARPGLFFVCEQVVPGHSGALVIFVPVARTAAGYEYQNTALVAESAPAGEWGKRTIEGARWVYSWASSDEGRKILWRNINTFTDSDQIHFEISRSEDGQTWKTTKSGDE